MSDGMQELKREARAVGSAPLVFGIALVVLAGAIWGFMHWSYSAALTAKDAHIASLQRRLDEYRDALNGASAEEARRRIESLEAEIGSLRVRLTPRRLEAGQRQAIADRSRRPAGVASRPLTVIVQSTCSDCAAFATELTEALGAAGNWSTTVQTSSEITDRPRSGLGIRFPDRTRPPQDAVVLQQALRSAGLSFTMLAGGSGGVELLVTERTAP